MHTRRVASCDGARGRGGRCVAGGLLAVALVLAGGHGVAGHSVGHYPSYYPDEIRIDVVEPATAGGGLVDGTLHAYVGATPAFPGPLPKHVKSATALGTYIVISFNTALPAFPSADRRCAAARSLLAALSGESTAGFVFHPYPVTPYHADVLHHLDRIEAAKRAAASAPPPVEALAVGARGALAEAIVRARFGRVAEGAELILEALPVDDMLTAAGAQFTGDWSGPSWLKEGWFQAHLLLAPSLDAATREAADDDLGHLIRGEARELAERADLERSLIATITRGCARVVAGYVPRREFYNDMYPDGVENVAFDSLDGLNSPLFIRTVKLKDYPWNGKLRLGTREAANAAWNPIAGFTDTSGRLIWSAIGDPAMIPFPFNASWMPNRVQAEVSRTIGQSGGINVPADALRPEPGNGALRPVGERTVASAKITYRVLASRFEDGTEMTAADLFYPFAFAYRWGAGASSAGSLREPRLGPLFAAMHERLIGLKLIDVEKSNHAIAEGMNVVLSTPVLEVYLRDAPGDETQLAALAPPWSTVPWHLMVLMEQAVTRGYAAFSQEEATRRKVPWLDLVRDPALRGRLKTLIAELQRTSHRPEALKELVTPEEAQARWRALSVFSEKHGHLLVANGPYRLKSWDAQSVVLEAVRDVTYPLGFGTFDRFVNPPRAALAEVTQTAGRIIVRADAEMILKAGRDYKLTKEPLLRTTTRGVQGLLVVSRYLLIGPDGKVLKVDKMHWEEDGQFTIELTERLPSGRYTLVLGILLDGNALDPPASILHFRVDATGAPR
jgi:hypothetical protein